jgi:hypothetical protein
MSTVPKMIGIVIWVLVGSAIAQVDFIQSFDDNSERIGESWNWRKYLNRSVGPEFEPQLRNGSLVLENENTTFSIAFYRLDASVLNATAAALYGWRVASLVLLSHQSLSPSDKTVGDGFALSIGPIPSNMSYFASLANTMVERGDASRGVFAFSHETYINGMAGIHVTTDGGRNTVEYQRGTLLSQNESGSCSIVIEVRPTTVLISSQGLRLQYNQSFNTGQLPPLSTRIDTGDMAWYWSARSGSSTAQTELQQVAVSVLADTCDTFTVSCPANSIALTAQGRSICIVFSEALAKESSNQVVEVNFSDVALGVFNGSSQVLHSSIDNQGRVFALSVYVTADKAWAFTRLDVCQFVLLAGTERIMLDRGVPVFSSTPTTAVSALTTSSTQSSAISTHSTIASSPTTSTALSDLSTSLSFSSTLLGIATPTQDAPLPVDGRTIGGIVGGIVGLLCLVGLVIAFYVVARRRSRLPRTANTNHVVEQGKPSHYADAISILTNKPSNYDALSPNEI